jgi:hypothetical protein
MCGGFIPLELTCVSNKHEHKSENKRLVSYTVWGIFQLEKAEFEQPVCMIPSSNKWVILLALFHFQGKLVTKTINWTIWR